MLSLPHLRVQNRECWLLGHLQQQWGAMQVAAATVLPSSCSRCSIYLKACCAVSGFCSLDSCVSTGWCAPGPVLHLHAASELPVVLPHALVGAPARLLQATLPVCITWPAPCMCQCSLGWTVHGRTSCPCVHVHRVLWLGGCFKLLWQDTEGPLCCMQH